jgi:hypothetical protein
VEYLALKLAKILTLSGKYSTIDEVRHTKNTNSLANDFLKGLADPRFFVVFLAEFLAVTVSIVLNIQLVNRNIVKFNNKYLHR